MSRPLAYPLAVQQAALLHAVPDGAPHLAFEGNSAWQHLNDYLAQTDNVSAGSDPALAAAAQAVADVAARFGTPRRLRALLATAPGILAQEAPPDMLYAGLVWLAAHLKNAAASILSFQQSLLASGVPASDRREALQAIGQLAEQARSPLAPLLHALALWKAAIVPANAALAQQAQQAGTTLQAGQEGLGRLQASIDALETQLAGLGLFSGHKKKELEQQLLLLREQLAADTASSESLRQQLASVNLLLSNAGWLEAAVDALSQWYSDLRAGWSTLGAGVTQLAADASDTALADDAGLAQTLASGTALPLWQALVTAAQDFGVNALVDFSPAAKAKRWQP